MFIYRYVLFIGVSGLILAQQMKWKSWCFVSYINDRAYIKYSTVSHISIGRNCYVLCKASTEPLLHNVRYLCNSEVIEELVYLIVELFSKCGIVLKDRKLF